MRNYVCQRFFYSFEFTLFSCRSYLHSSDQRVSKKFGMSLNILSDMDASVLENDNTSPTQLQEVTLDPNASLPFTMGTRSPGKVSPLRGHSVKEYEEQLSGLMKENFNLKLRIYFLEERMGRILGPRDVEDAIKKNIELNVENETIRKELKDKHTLLIQSLKALELVEEDQRRLEKIVKANEIEFAQIAEAHQKEIAKLKLLEIKPTGPMCSIQSKAQLEQEQEKTKEELSELQAQINDLQTEVEHLQVSLNEEREHTLQLEQDVEDSVKDRCQVLETKLCERNAQIDTLNKEVQDKSATLSAANQQIRAQEDHIKSAEANNAVKDSEIEDLNKIINNKCSHLEEQVKTLSELRKVFDQQVSQIECLKTSVFTREKAIAELEEKLERAASHSRTVESKLESNTRELKRYQEEIEQLRTDRASLKLNRNRSRSSAGSSKSSKTDISTTSSPSRDEVEKQLQCIKLNSEISKREDELKQMQTQLVSRNTKIAKLETENTRALQVIREFMSRESKKESSLSVNEEIQKKDKEIGNLKKELRALKETFITKPGEVNTASGSSPAAETSNSSPLPDSEQAAGEDGFEDNCRQGKWFTEQYLQQTNDMEKQIQDLLESLAMKETAQERYQQSLEENQICLTLKDNRIAELEQSLEELRIELYNTEERLTALSAEKMDKEKDENDLQQMIDTRDKEIERLESELRKRTVNLQELVNKELWDKNREIERLQKRLRALLDQKESEIMTLQFETREKDAIIRRYEETVIHLGSGDTFPQIEQLQGQLQELQDKNKFLTGTIDDLKVKLRNTPERDSECRILKELRLELVQCQDQLQASEKSKRDVLEICSMLTTRLEELALFLNSLLNHKSVLGILGAEKQNALRNVIEKSLDLSRTLSMSISVNQDQSLLQLSSISDILNSSRLSTVSDLKRDVFDIQNGMDMTYNNHFCTSHYIPTETQTEGETTTASVTPRDVVTEQAKEIEFLKLQLETLKAAVEKRDTETSSSKPAIFVRTRGNESSLKNDTQLIDVLLEMQTQSKLEKSPSFKHNKYVEKLVDHSESEAWSEPDRSVSLARIGLIEDTLKALSPGNSSVNRSRTNKTHGSGVLSESTEEEKNGKTPSRRSEERISSTKRNLFGECRHNSPTLQEQYFKLQTQLKEKDNELLTAQCAMLELENKMKEDKLKLAQQFEELRLQKIEARRVIQDVEDKVKRAERHKRDIENEVAKLEVMVQQLLQKKNALSTDLEMNVRNSRTAIEFLEKERDEAIIEATEAQKRADGAFAEIKLREMQLTSLQEAFNALETQITNDTEFRLKNAIKEIEEKSSLKIIDIHNDAERRINQLEENERQLKNTIEAEWVSKDRFNEKIRELQSTYTEISNLKLALKEADNRITTLEKCECDLQQQLADVDVANKTRITSLRKELDEASLVASRASTERTKMTNEKIRLEKQVKLLEMSVSEFERKENDYKTKLLDQTRIESELKQLVDQKETEHHQKIKEWELSYNATKEMYSMKLMTLEQKKNSLEIRISELENTNADLHNRLVKLQVLRQNESIDSNKTSPTLCRHGQGGVGSQRLNMSAFRHDVFSNFSGYTSEDIPVSAYEIVPNSVDNLNVWNHNNVGEDRDRIAVNSSPDLGIESDQGRFSSLEANTAPPAMMRPFLPPLELSHSMNNLLAEAATAVDTKRDAGDGTEVQKLKNENLQLKARLVRTRKALEDTVQQLSKSNERKKQVEKAVCKQIHKTSLVLRKARANLDSGSESEAAKLI